MSIAPDQDDRAIERGATLLSAWWYRNYVLGLLFLTYVLNVIDRSPVLGVSLQFIKEEFGASDTQLGLLSGLAFTLFYSTMGIPIAALADRSSRVNVLAVSVAVWSGMTALCGAAVNFGMLFFTRVGTAVGEAGGSPPSHSLISDYFPKSERGRAFATFALGVPIGTAIGNYIAGQSIQAFGWRTTFMLVGLPGILVALLVRLTIKEPPRGFADGVSTAAARGKAPGMLDALRVMWQIRSFRHLSLAAALHSVAWYAGSSWNATFLIRSHQMTAAETGNWLTLFSAVGAIGTFLGGYLSDRLSVRFNNDRRWYMWVPGIATLSMVPFQFGAYLVDAPWLAFSSFSIMMLLAAVFFGPSFAMTQALASLRMRSVATSLLLFVQTMIGYGLGPWVTGRMSDMLNPSYGVHSLRYALVIIGLVNIWAAVHYVWGARTLRTDLARNEAAAAS